MHDECCGVQATDQSSMLNDASLVATIFAPTNDAFNTVLSQYGITTQQALSQPSLLKGVRLDIALFLVCLVFSLLVASQCCCASQPCLD